MTAPAVEPALRRATIQLDDGWTFVADPTEVLRADSVPDGVPVAVPGAWEDLIGGVGGLVTGWYRRFLELPTGWRGDRIAIRFGAVMERCEVWLDQRPIGSHVGGYTPFELEVERGAADGRVHELLIRVSNPFGRIEKQPAYSGPDELARVGAAFGEGFEAIPGGKQTWYTATSGLVRPVTLERRPDVHLGRLRVRPNLAGSSVAIGWTLGRSSDPHDATSRTINVTVSDPAGSIAAEWSGDTRPGSSGEATIVLKDPIPWDVGRPAFFEVRAATGRRDGAIEDVVTARFGMRDVATEGGRVMLNGRPIYLLGALDQDFYPNTRSTPPSRDFLDEQLVRARELGLNLLRCHITVPDERYLDAADEAGMLLWCELPNWTRFSEEAGERGLAVLADIVAALDHHPSVVAWTIINEDWGTDLRHDATHRAWLGRAYERIKALDPTRLVIDNSACGRPGEENAHVRSDLADFHVYHLVPDHADQWRDRIADFATRPDWLWSGDGDARARGDEPLILSEFGSWGLPDLRTLTSNDGRDPWWFATGPPAGSPGGMAGRVAAYGLDRVFGDHAGLIRATQEHQLEALRYQIAELRRHASIGGYVITEFSDIYWEANGLLDMYRRPKAFHDRFAAINTPDVVIAILEPRDRLGGEEVRIPIVVSAWSGEAPSRGHVAWELSVGDAGSVRRGRLGVTEVPSASAAVVGAIELDLPDVDRATRAGLRLEFVDVGGRSRARAELPFAILPRAVGLLDRAALAGELGVSVTDRLDAEGLARLRAGERVLLLARTDGAIDPGIDLPSSVRVHSRAALHPDEPEAGAVWDGDWMTTFAWLRSESLRDLSEGRCLDLAFQRVLPDHVLLGHPAEGRWDDVSAGMFAGWVHAPAAITWTMAVAAGHLTITTFHLEPGRGPVANALFAELVRALAKQDGPAVREEAR